jgi:arginine deiminase
MEFGGHSEVAPIRRLLLKHCREGFVSQQQIDDEAGVLNYTGVPDFEAALREYETFVELLSRFDLEIDMLPEHDGTTLDSIYVHDPVVISNRGAVLCNMGKRERAREPEAIAAHLDQLGIPVLGSIEGEGRLEGGDLIWLGDRVVAVGEGYRTNAEGIRQLGQLLGDAIDDLIVVPLPHWNGPADVLHLMSLVSPIDFDLLLVYSPLLPVPFRQWLVSRGMGLVEVPEEEFATMGCNVLAVAPRQCIMLAGNPQTEQRLSSAGAEVLTYTGTEISRKGEGGPTCLTRPLHRAT